MPPVTSFATPAAPSPDTHGAPSARRERRTGRLAALLALSLAAVVLPAGPAAATEGAGAAEDAVASTPVPFLSYPRREPIVREGGSNVTIENVSIDGGSVDDPRGIGITIRNVHGTITIRNVDLSDLEGGIYIYGSTGTLLIENVRARNIGTGTIGSGRSNHIQLAESSFSGRIRDNLFLGGRTEDMVSTWRSGGRGPGDELIIEDNRFQGLVEDSATARAWTSSSGTGIIIGDGPGDHRNGYVIVRDNSLLDPGQVGIQHIDGPGIQTYGNTLYGHARSGSNNALTSWDGAPDGVIRDNRYEWAKSDGSPADPWFHAGSRLTVEGNVRDTGLSPSTMEIHLP